MPLPLLLAVAVGIFGCRTDSLRLRHAPLPHCGGDSVAADDGVECNEEAEQKYFGNEYSHAFSGCCNGGWCCNDRPGSVADDYTEHKTAAGADDHHDDDDNDDGVGAVHYGEAGAEIVRGAPVHLQTSALPHQHHRRAADAELRNHWSQHCSRYRGSTAVSLYHHPQHSSVYYS